MPLPPPPTQPGSRVRIKATTNSNTARPVPDADRAALVAKSKPTRPSPAPVKQHPGAASPARQPTPSPVGKQQPAGKTVVRPASPVARQIETRETADTRPAPMPAPQPRVAPARSSGPVRLFVLDTNVLLHDPGALFRFQEHDIFIPMVVLEELDAHKKGTTEVARNGRQTSRMLDALVATTQREITQGIALSATGQVLAGGKLFFQTEPLESPVPRTLPTGTADNQILGLVAALEKKHPRRDVILVSKDINMRVKARALGLRAEDYESDKVLDDRDLLYSGAYALPADFWKRQTRDLESWQSGSETWYRLRDATAADLHVNQFVWYEAADEPALHTRVTAVDGNTATLRTLKDYTHTKTAVWGVTARNREQNFALNLLMDPDIDFVTLAGTAGTGKTLLALAAGLNQVLEERRYSEIIMTRATVSVGEDIGYLPGTEEEKMGPWMGALDDNLEFLATGEGSGGGGDWGRAATNDWIRSRVKIKSMSFMRGRTFINKWIIVDEAQNLTPKQIKTLVTRAGPGTKIVCMGNLGQIDTPYLTEGSSGLTFAVTRFRDWPHGGHITLARGERSRLADYASEAL